MNLKRYFLAVLCIAIFGCTPVYDVNGDEIGYDKDKAEYKWGGWGHPELISIADDSLAILAIYKPYYKEWRECGFEGCYTEWEVVDYRIGLFLVNYREKQKPVWGDTLEQDLIVVREYFKDSSVLVFDRTNNKFGFWKIGARLIEFTDYEDLSGIENRKYISYNARPFANGNIILFSYPKLLLLEVETMQLKPFEFSGEYEWLSKCTNSLKKDHEYNPIGGTYYFDYYYNYMNVSYIGGELSCIRGNETANNFELTVSDAVMDTIGLYVKSTTGCITGWYGNYVRDASNKVYKIDILNFKFDSTYASIRFNEHYQPIFYNAEGLGLGPINYSTQDLLGVYE